MKKVVIIGAGPAGLTAALELLRRGGNGYEVTVLEESGCVGGISRTVNVGGNRMDLGGHRFFSKSAAVRGWWQSLLPLQGAPSLDDLRLGRQGELTPGGPDPEKTDRAMLRRRRVSRIFCFGKFFDYPISLKLRTLIGLGPLRTLTAGLSYLKALLFKREENSLEDFYINRFGKKLYSLFFRDYTEKLWGRPASELSPDWGAQRVKGLSVLEALKNAFSHGKSTETSLIESFNYPKFGPGQLWEAAAREIGERGGKLVMNTRVTGVLTEGERVVRLLAEGENGAEFYAGDIFLSSMPLKDLIAAFPDGAVPDGVREITEGLPYRDFVTVGLLVDRLRLKNRTGIPTLGGIVPDCWVYVQDKSVKLGRIQIFNNWSPYMVRDPESSVWLGLEFFCSEGDAFWEMSERDCIGFAANELVRLGFIEKGAIISGHRERVKKAYPAYFGAYEELPKLRAFLDSYSNLYCIGRNGQHRYNNMDHSMLTAFEAVACVLGCGDRARVWNVNMDESYQEDAVPAGGIMKNE